MRSDEGETVVEIPVAPPASYGASRLNAVQHGVLSQFTVLPWEDFGEYAILLHALISEHQPLGPTEAHLVEELAGVLWRKRRLRMAEAASFNRGLQATTETYSKTAAAALVMAGPKSKINVLEAIKVTPIEVQRELAELDRDEGMTHRAIEILKNASQDTYSDGLEALDESTREAWADQVAWTPEDYDEETAPYASDAASLLRYLETSILPWYDERRSELRSGPLVRAQALGCRFRPFADTHSGALRTAFR